MRTNANLFCPELRTGGFSDEKRTIEESKSTCKGNVHPEGSDGVSNLAFDNFANASVEWLVNGSTTEGWTGDDAYICAADSDNVLYASTYVGANDPRISSPSINISMDSYGIVEIRMSSICSNKQGYVYFRKSGWSESSKVSFSTSSSWNTYQVDMTNNSYWDGSITAIRIDYASTGDSGECLAAFDWIRILPENGSISGGVRDYYTGAALSNVAVRLEKNGVIKKRTRLHGFKRHRHNQ